METVTHGMLIMSAVCLTIGCINLRLWFGERKSYKFLAIGIACLAVATFSWFEVTWLQAETPLQFGNLVRWGHIPSSLVVVSLGVFLYLHLEAGRRWLLFLIFALRALGLLLNFISPVNIGFKEITSLGHITFLGEKLTFPIGTPSPAIATVYAAALLLIVFSIDASITAWRRGDHRKAMVFGGSIALFGVFSITLSVLAITGFAVVPALISPSFLFLLAAMGLELNYDVKRSERLSRDLNKSRSELSDTVSQLNISAEAAQVGVWTRDVGTDRLWSNSHWRHLFEFGEPNSFTFTDWLQKLHPEDRERVDETLETAIKAGEPYQTEYRIRLADGGIRWIRSTGQAEHSDDNGTLVRGAAVDITQLKLAEKDAHELSHKLMNAQEKERARLARELHDDLSQSLALLSIKLQGLNNKPNGPESIKKQVGQLTAQIQRLSSDVHRISHELHPSKLNQLGLESALRGFCREAGAVRGIKIEFECLNVPRDLPNDVTLCLYRIAQEAIQNINKHSGASVANINLSDVDSEIRLEVSDNGCGFNPDDVKSKEALGLVSMDERVRAVNGKLTIESVLDSGTKIEVRVPLAV